MAEENLMISIDDLTDHYAKHTSVNYVGLWMIVARLREQHELTDLQALMDAALEVGRRLVARHVCPGDYTSDGFRYWPLDADACIRRIRRKWETLGHDPTLADPFCWFAPREGAHWQRRFGGTPFSPPSQPPELRLATEMNFDEWQKARADLLKRR
jgi:hypothetical protein